MVKLSWARAAAWRLRRHFLDRRAPAGSILAVASQLCGLHAQVMSSAELTAWARVEDLPRGAVQRALWEDRSLVKTWAMRGTLHLLPAHELPLWYAGLHSIRHYLRAAWWQKYYSITLDELDRVSAAVAVALHQRVMTREELVREVGRLTGLAAFRGELADDSWGMLLKPAAFAGHLCFGPSVGTRVRFTHPESWLAAAQPPGPRVDPQSAPAAITRRFLAAYGPATCHDLARWWGGSGSISTARRWIASLGEEVAPVDLEGEHAWMLAADVREARDAAPVRSARLLPGFDQYVVAASCHAERLLPGDWRSRVYRPQGWISPVLLVNGRMMGTWRHERKGSRLAVVVEPFVPAPLWVRRAAQKEAERLAAFFGAPLSLSWKS